MSELSQAAVCESDVPTGSVTAEVLGYSLHRTSSRGRIRPPVL